MHFISMSKKVPNEYSLHNFLTIFTLSMKELDYTFHSELRIQVGKCLPHLNE